MRRTAPMQVPGYLRKRPNKKKILIFVHGLQGDPFETWTNRNGTYWPTLIETDSAFEDWDIYVYAYPSGFVRECHTIPDFAAEMRTRLSEVADRYETIAFVGHSQGGLIVRQTLLTYGGALADKTAALVFYGTPTGGSELANEVGIFSHCVDDLRTIGSNAFLKTQNDEWQQKELKRHIRTTCGFEYDENVVSEASARLLCDDPEQIATNHAGLVKPACINDHSHQLLRRAIEAIAPSTVDPAQDGGRTVDPEVLQRAEQEQAAIRERDVLRFWDTIHGGETIYDDEMQAIIDLTGKPLETRFATLNHVFKSYEAAQRYKSRHHAIVRAAVGMNPDLRRRVAAVLLQPLASSEAPWVREAVVETAKDLEVTVASPPAAPARYVDPGRREFFDALRAWPELSAALDTLIHASTEDDKRQAVALIATSFRNLTAADQRQFQVRVTQVLLTVPYWEKGRLCPSTEVLGIKDVIAKRVMADLDDENGSPSATLALPGCLSPKDEERVLANAFAPSAPSFYNVLLANYLFLAPRQRAAAVFARRLEDLTKPDKVVRDRAVFLLQTAAWQRPEIIEAAHLTKLLNDAVACDAVRQEADHNQKILVEPSTRVFGADALEYWQALVRCRTHSSLSATYFILIAANITSKVPLIQHRSIFFQLMESLWYTVNWGLSLDDTRALRLLMAQRTEDELHDVRVWFLRSVEMPVTGFQSEIATLFSERIPDVTAEEMSELRRIKSKCVIPTNHALSFYRAFDAANLDSLIPDLLIADTFGAPWRPGAEVQKSENPRERRRYLIDTLSASLDRLTTSGVEAVAHELSNTTDVSMLARVDRLVQRPFTSDVDEDRRAVFCLASTGDVRSHIRAAALENLNGDPDDAATALRFFMATDCKPGDPFRSDIAERARQAFVSTRSARVMRTLAFALSYCSDHRSMVTADVVNEWKVVLGDAATPADVRRLLDVANILHFDVSEVADRFWNRMAAVVGEADRAGAVELMTVVNALPPVRSNGVVCGLLRFPFLDVDLENAILHQLSSPSSRPSPTFWQTAAPSCSLVNNW